MQGTKNKQSEARSERGGGGVFAGRTARFAPQGLNTEESLLDGSRSRVVQCAAGAEKLGSIYPGGLLLNRYLSGRCWLAGIMVIPLRFLI